MTTAKSKAVGCDESGPQPLTAYVVDEGRMAEIATALGKATNMKELCHNAIWNIYTHDLAGVEKRNEILVSATFIKSLLPMITNLRGVRTVANVRDAIYRYLLVRGKTIGSGEILARSIVTQPMQAYIADEKRMAEIVATLAKVKTMATLCSYVIASIYNNELAGEVNRRAIIVSAPFIKSIIPLMTGYGRVCSEKNIRDAVYRHILNKKQTNQENTLI